MRGLTERERDLLVTFAAPIASADEDFDYCTPVEEMIVGRLIARGLISSFTLIDKDGYELRDVAPTTTTLGKLALEIDAATRSHYR